MRYQFWKLYANEMMVFFNNQMILYKYIKRTMADNKRDSTSNTARSCTRIQQRHLDIENILLPHLSKTNAENILRFPSF